MSATGWFFTYVAPDGSEADWPASTDSPFYKTFDGRVWTFKERKFIAEGLSEAGFWQLRQTTKCPALPTKPEVMPETPFGSWTPASAKEAADRMDSAQLRCACEADSQFSAALDSLKKELPVLDGISQASKDATYFREIAERNRGRGFDFTPAPPQTTSTDEFVDVGRGAPVHVSKPDQRQKYYRSYDEAKKEKH